MAFRNRSTGGFVLASTIAALGIPPSGRAAWIELGSPNMFKIGMVYNATEAKWVSITHWYKRQHGGEVWVPDSAVLQEVNNFEWIVLPFSGSVLFDAGLKLECMFGGNWKNTSGQLAIYTEVSGAAAFTALGITGPSRGFSAESTAGLFEYNDDKDGDLGVSLPWFSLSLATVPSGARIALVPTARWNNFGASAAASALKDGVIGCRIVSI